MIVGNKQLVVHAPVGAPEVDQIAQPQMVAPGKRVEQSHFKIIHPGQVKRQAAQCKTADIVQQQVNLHAALNRLICLPNARACLWRNAQAYQGWHLNVLESSYVSSPWGCKTSGGGGGDRPGEGEGRIGCCPRDPWESC